MSVRRIKTRKEHGCYECLRAIKPALAIVVKTFTKYEDDNTGEVIIFSYTCYYHLRCWYRKTRSAERFKGFAAQCRHPQAFIETEYSYIPGEAVMQPERDVCRLCNRSV